MAGEDARPPRGGGSAAIHRVPDRPACSRRAAVSPGQDCM